MVGRHGYELLSSIIRHNSSLLVKWPQVTASTRVPSWPLKKVKLLDDRIQLTSLPGTRTTVVIYESTLDKPHHTSLKKPCLCLELVRVSRLSPSHFPYFREKGGLGSKRIEMNFETDRTCLSNI